MNRCDACQTRPSRWTATFTDGVAYDVCDDCAHLCDDRVALVSAHTAVVAECGM